MASFGHELAANVGVVTAFLLAWALAQDWLFARGRLFRNIAMGLFMGAASMASMMLAIRIAPGVIFDLRHAPVALAGLFGGPVAAVIAAGIAGAYRLVYGGTGMPAGIVAIAMSMLIGVVAHIAFARRRIETLHVFVVAFFVASAALLAALTLPNSASLTPGIVQMALIIFGATMGAGWMICRAQRQAALRNLWRVALMQAPDFHYVKDRSGVFAAVNEAVAHFNGFDVPARMIGKSDFDLTDHERATELFRVEQEIMRTGVPLLDHQEQLTGSDGRELWFATSKVPIHDADGETIGIAGVTRDITEHQRMEAALTDSRNLLRYAVEGMSDGLAMFDRTGHLVYSNDRYRAMFPLTGEMRQPGAHMRDILRHVVATGEQLNLGDPEAWIRMVLGTFRMGGEEQVSLLDGRWLHIRTRPTEHGAAMVVVSDVTTLKKAEGELLSLTSQLRVLADTDGLTGLMNRRSFDARIEAEVARSRDEKRPLSLVLFDVDHFKSYNDTLGHPAGDECLKLIARCVKSSLLRPDDVVARYGGEEFVAILPDTDEDSAFLVAERARAALAELRLPHAESRTGMVTLSAGLATYVPDAASCTAFQLLSRADEALYQAKAAGRNRVMGWHPRHSERAAS